MSPGDSDEDTMSVRDGWRKLVKKLSGGGGGDGLENEQEVTAFKAKLYGPTNLNLVRTVGTGSFGRVFMATVNDSTPPTDPSIKMDELPLTVAVKRMKKASLVRSKQIEHITQERAILKSMEHPFIVRYLHSFKDDHYLYIVMDFVQGGEFFTYLRKKGRLPTDHVQFYSAQVAMVFEYIHSKDIIYRDLKPENLLIERDGYIKFTDFGFAKKVPIRTYTLCGTPEYMAPEILTNKGHGKPADWWTLGIFMYEMICGYGPFTDADTMKIYQKILTGVIRFPRGFDKEAKSLVKHLLCHDISFRYGALKGGADDVKKHRFFTGIDYWAMMNKTARVPYMPPYTEAGENFHIYTESKVKPPPVTGAADPFLLW